MSQDLNCHWWLELDDAFSMFLKLENVLYIL